MNNKTFPADQFNKKVNDLIKQGFDEYLTALEDGITHVILTNTKPGHKYNGVVVDVYDSGKIEYSNQ